MTGHATTKHASMSADQVKQAQQKLKGDGDYMGQVDGKFGPKTAQAVKQYQKKNGLQQTGRLDRDTLGKLTARDQRWLRLRARRPPPPRTRDQARRQPLPRALEQACRRPARRIPERVCRPPPNRADRSSRLRSSTSFAQEPHAPARRDVQLRDRSRLPIILWVRIQRQSLSRPPVQLGAYPRIRLRRNRRDGWSRRLVAEDGADAGGFHLAGVRPRCARCAPDHPVDAGREPAVARER